jgi:PhnB protein
MLIPTIHFPNTCDEAIIFYKDAIGAEVRKIEYFRDAPKDTGFDEQLWQQNSVMHSEVLIFGTLISMTDGVKERVKGENFTLTVFLNSTEEVTSVFNRLADGGQVVQAPTKEFWASLTCIVTDRFGVNWNICTSDALG